MDKGCQRTWGPKLPWWKNTFGFKDVFEEVIVKGAKSQVWKTVVVGVFLEDNARCFQELNHKGQQTTTGTVRPGETPSDWAGVVSWTVHQFYLLCLFFQPTWLIQCLFCHYVCIHNWMSAGPYEAFCVFKAMSNISGCKSDDTMFSPS